GVIGKQSHSSFIFW
ncbi:putative membrane protein, partial [Escherichia coli 8.2524]